MAIASPAAPETVDVHPYKHESALFALHVVFSAIFWLLLMVGTLGLALAYLLLFFVIYLFAQSGLIAWIRGNGVRITPQQFPDLYKRYAECCGKLGLKSFPQAYVVNGNGVMNAFATRFLGHHFVVLNSDVIDALADKPDAIGFYIGHELGHIRRGHLAWAPFIWPATILPLLGAGYSRAREYTCDQFGRACCADQEAAIGAVVALAAGGKRWSSVNVPAYLDQLKYTRGFWMSFHELVADYPWLVKRAARVNDPDYRAPPRNVFALILALFVPRLAVGGGAGGMLVMVMIIGILAAIAIPAYHDYTIRAHTAEAATFGRSASLAVGTYYERNRKLPASLADAGVPASTPSVRDARIDPRSGVLELAMAAGPVAGKKLLFIPSVGAGGQLQWRCMSQDIEPKYLPMSCREQK